MSLSQISIPSHYSIPTPNVQTMRDTFWSGDYAMDLGTANTLIYRSGVGIVLNEPSVVAIDTKSSKVKAVGKEAKSLFGKTPQSIRCFRPMKDGVIADFGIATLMIQHFLKKVRVKLSIRRPAITIGVPSGITQVEKRAVIDAAIGCGFRNVSLVEESTAAAIGSGILDSRAQAQMIIDIGGGTTEVAILSMGGIAYSHAIRVAGDEIDEAIARHLKFEHNLEIGVFEAERIKMTIGNALESQYNRTIDVHGIDLAKGTPKKVSLTSNETVTALEKPLGAIANCVITALERVSPEVLHDICASGIKLAGGGALIHGIDRYLSAIIGIRCTKASDPLNAVVRGVGAMAENSKQFTQLCIA